MKNEYTIINKTAIQKRIDNLDLIINNGKPSGSDYIELKLLKQILSQSTPLIPEIEKAFNASKITTGMNQRNQFAYKYKNSKDYISNLKLEI